MNSGFDEISLALFTTLAPAGVIAFIALAAARLFADQHEKAVRIDRMIALPFSVCLVGFIASATHLGTPANALHVFSGVGRSPLSNEVFSAVVFLFFVGSYWMMAFKQTFPDKIAHIWLAAGTIAGLVFLACTSTAYAVHTVPTWDTVFSPANMLLAAFFTGPLFGMFFLLLCRTERPLLPRLLLTVSSIAFVVGVIVLAMHQQSLGNIANNETSALALAPHYPSIIAAHAVLGLFSLASAAFSLRKGGRFRAKLIACGIGVLAASIAVFITRIAFYQLHMTLGF